MAEPNRAGVMTAPGQLEIREVAKPEPLLGSHVPQQGPSEPVAQAHDLAFSGGYLQA